MSYKLNVIKEDFPEHIFYQIGFDDYVLCTFDDVINNPTDRFYYIVPYYDNSSIVDYENKLMLSDAVIGYLKQYPNLYVIFINPHEMDTSHVLKDLKIKLMSYELNPQQFYVINNNALLKEQKALYGADINVYSFSGLLYWNMRLLSEYKPAFIEEKPFMFMCHNRNAFSHRLVLLHYLLKHNILSNTDWSLIRNANFARMDNMAKRTILQKILTPSDVDDLLDEMDYFHNTPTKRSAYEMNFPAAGLESEGSLIRNAESKDITNTYCLDTYQNSYINIVTETNFLHPVIHITEKTLKPLYFYQLPLILASQNHVARVKSLYDIDFFDDLIDHSYDGIADNRTRIMKFIDEIVRLDENKDDVKLFYKSNKERIIKNQQKVLDILKQKKDAKFFKSLIYSGKIL